MRNTTGDVRQTEVSPLKPEGEVLVVEPQQVQQCCVKIIDVHRILDHVEPDVIGFPIAEPRLHSPPQPSTPCRHLCDGHVPHSPESLR